MAFAYTDHFYYLPVPDHLEFEDGLIEPVPNLDQITAAVAKWTHPDGHVYPRMQKTMRQKPGWKRPRKVPQSERPGLLHQLPTTHSLHLANPVLNQEQARYGPAGFLIHFLGFLYGFQCQFHDWWMDGRVSVRTGADHPPPTASRAGNIITRALRTWHSFAPRQRLVATNLLYLHSRTVVYEMEWECFQAEYQVLDAVFALARDTGQIPPRPRIPHDQRIAALCNRFGIPLDGGILQTVVRLRNELLHEVLWDGRMPGEARSPESLLASEWVHRLVRRATFAALGLHGTYIRTPWWGFGTFVFDVSGDTLPAA